MKYMIRKTKELKENVDDYCVLIKEAFERPMEPLKWIEMVNDIEWVEML